MVEIAAIILAGGRSSRFAHGSTKLVADFRGKPLIRHVVDAAAASLASPVIVVTGHARENIQAVLGRAKVSVVHNADYEMGIASSLRCGLMSLPSRVDGALICLADMPGITSSLINALIEAYGPESSAQAVIPTHDGRQGNPVLIARSLFERVASLSGDEGAKRLLKEADIGIVEVPAGHTGVLIDIDTCEDLDALSRQSFANPC